MKNSNNYICCTNSQLHKDFTTLAGLITIKIQLADNLLGNQANHRLSQDCIAEIRRILMCLNE